LQRALKKQILAAKFSIKDLSRDLSCNLNEPAEFNLFRCAPFNSAPDAKSFLQNILQPDSAPARRCSIDFPHFVFAKLETVIRPVGYGPARWRMDRLFALSCETFAANKRQ